MRNGQRQFVAGLRGSASERNIESHNSFMVPDREKFLSLKIVPARLTAEETAWYLGFAAHDIPVLVGSGLLKPLGHPSENSVKFFPLPALEILRSDVKWLSRATDAILDHWRAKNARKPASADPVAAN